MARPPTSFELGHARKLVIKVNACRRKQRLMAQRQDLDQAAWQMVLTMQGSSYQQAGGYPKGMTPAERVRKLGLRPKREPVEKCAYKPRQRLLWSKDDLLRHVVEDWLEDVAFRSVVLDPAYVCCGAAYRDNCYVLILAG